MRNCVTTAFFESGAMALTIGSSVFSCLITHCARRATGVVLIASNRRTWQTPDNRPNYNSYRMKPTRVRFLFSYFLTVCAFAASVGVVYSQKPKPSPSPTPLSEQNPDSVRIPIRRVRLPITVLDKKGQFVSGLTKNDFVVLEDKVPQQIETFSDDLSQTSPLFIAVLMDTSPSTAGKLRFEQESAMNFIHTVVTLRKDKVLSGTFDDEITLLQDFT